LAALIQTGERNGYPMQIAAAASRVNEAQRKQMIAKIREALGGLKGKTLGMLGLSFKPNTNDLREAPALAIGQELLAEGATIRAYDPQALEEACRILPGLQPCRDAYHAAEGADALIIMTEWNLFRSLEFEKLRTVMRSPVLLDLRNVYDSERVTAAGFTHISVGRRAHDPKNL
jgi:UDPglucose 6-dehydrogenase